MTNEIRPLRILVSGESARISLNLNREGTVLSDQIDLNLREYGFAKLEGETPADYIRRVREYFVQQTPSADSTPETLR